MTTHTPGPWTVEPVAATLSAQQQDYLVTYTDGNLRSHICRLFDNALCNEHGTTAANAALISAAPDLLAALEGVIRVVDRATDEFDAARSAIAKARGAV